MNNKEIEKRASVFSNLASEKVFVDVNQENTSLKVYNALGEKMYEEKMNTIATTINVKNWAEGMYLFVTQHKKEKESFKVIIK